MQIKKLLATLGVAGAMILSGCAGTYDSEVGWATPVEEDMVVTCSMSLVQIKKLLATLGVAGAMILSGCAGTYDSEVGWATPVEEDMVVTCSMSLETGDIKESSTFARKTVGDAGGKVTQYDVFDTSAGLTFDVPADKLDEVMDKLAEHDKVLSENMSGYI